MSDKWKKMFEGHALKTLAVLLCVALSASIVVYALIYFWSASAGATITTEVQNIIVLDEQGNEVTSINFGNINPSTKIYVRLTIKNVSPNATITISWSSTLSSVTNKITDNWSPDYPNSWPLTLGPGQSWNTRYYITVASDCPLQTYSWTLYIIPG
jgi:hypothetical protein